MVLIYRIYYRKTYPTATYISLLPVVVGVGLATSGEYSSTRLGFTLTLLGSFSAAVKTIVTNRLQTGTLSLPTLELLYRIGPLAFVQSALAGWVSGELKGLREEVLRKWWSEGWRGTGKGLVLVAANAGTALALNIASFTTNRDAGALTMAVAANVKQVLAIVISVGLHEVRVGVVNVVGKWKRFTPLSSPFFAVYLSFHCISYGNNNPCISPHHSSHLCAPRVSFPTFRFLPLFTSRKKISHSRAND